MPVSWDQQDNNLVLVLCQTTYVWVQNCSANYVWVRSLYSARLLNLSRLWLVLRQTVVVRTTTAHPLLRKILWKNSEGKNRTDKQVIDKIRYEIEFIGDDCNLSRERRLQFESRKICGFGNNFPELSILRLLITPPSDLNGWSVSTASILTQELASMSWKNYNTLPLAWLECHGEVETYKTSKVDATYGRMM